MGMARERTQVVAGKETEVVLTLKLGIDIAGQVLRLTLNADAHGALIQGFPLSLPAGS